MVNKNHEKENLLVAEKFVPEFDEAFVQKVDLADNSAETDSVSVAVCGFKPFWNKDKSMDECFWEAVSFAEGILRRQMEFYQSKSYAEKLIMEKVESVQNDILVLDKFIPYGRLLVDTDVNFVIFPSLRGGYGINSVEAVDGSKKVNFLPKWLGSKDESIGLTFCHKGNFTAAADGACYQDCGDCNRKKCSIV